MLFAFQILEWADAQFERTGRWPNARSGPVGDAFGTQWCSIEAALRMDVEAFRAVPRCGAAAGGSLEAFQVSVITEPESPLAATPVDGNGTVDSRSRPSSRSTTSRAAKVAFRVRGYRRAEPILRKKFMTLAP
jgi:hypothetical protein